MLTGRYRKGQQPTTHRSAFGFRYLSDERRLDAVERLIPLAAHAGIPLTHLALAFAIAHVIVRDNLHNPEILERNALGALTLETQMIPTAVKWAARLTPSGALTEALSRAMTMSVDWFGVVVLVVWGALAALGARRWFRFT